MYQLQIASVSPSGENAIADISHLCPTRAAKCVPVTAHPIAVLFLSLLPLASTVPSGEKATAVTLKQMSC